MSQKHVRDAGSAPWALFIGINSFSFRAHVAWNATKHDGFVHCMQAPALISHMLHLYESSERPPITRHGQLTNFHRCFDILSAPVTGSMKTSFATRVSGIQIAHSRCTHSPCTVCLKAPPSFGHNMHAWKTIQTRFNGRKSNIPQDFQARQCTYDRATVLLGYTGHRNSLTRFNVSDICQKTRIAYLDGRQDYIRHRTQWHCCSLPQNHHK